MLLDRILGKATTLTPAPSDDYWYMSHGRQVSSGVRVDQDSALNYSAVWAATRILSETVASLPLLLYHKRPAMRNGKDVPLSFYGTKELAVYHPLYTLMHDAPHPEMTSFT